MADEQQEKKIVEGCQVYAQAAERAKQGERTISLDELTGVQALERKAPDLPMQAGHVLRREFEYIRHGTLSWFISFDVVTGQVLEPSWGPTRTEEDALAHIQRLIASDRKATRWHLILDNLNIHQSESLVRWVAEREGIAPETLGIKGKRGILQSSWVWQQPFILTMTFLMGAGAFVFSGNALIIIILAQQQQASPVVVGLIFALGGIGAIAGSLLALRLEHRLTVGHSILLCRWYFVLSWPLYALAPFPWVLGALQFGTGLVDPIEDVPYFSHRLKLIPDELKGRVLSACRLVPGTMRPLGLALTGILIQQVGIFPTIWLAWAWLLVSTVIVTILPHVRRERAL